jgi:hypothetical protein
MFTQLKDVLDNEAQVDIDLRRFFEFLMNLASTIDWIRFSVERPLEALRIQESINILMRLRPDWFFYPGNRQNSRNG